MRSARRAASLDLFDAEAQLGESHVAGEQHVAGLAGNKRPNLLVRPWPPQLGHNVGINEPAPQSLTSRTGDFTDSRSIEHPSAANWPVLRRDRDPTRAS